MPEVFEVTRLTKLLLASRLMELQRLDAAVSAELGDTYSEEGWTMAHFELDLPGKWDCSALLVSKGELRGFWVGSARDGSVHYAHRVAVARSCRGRGGGRMLVDWVSACARSHGLVAMALKVSKRNRSAAAFYRKMGFRLDRDSAWSDERSDVYVLDLEG